MPSYACPECDARLTAGRPGTIVACGRCGNPVVVPEPRPEPPPAPPARAAPSPEAERQGARRLWRTAGLVVAVVALAHVGVYMLLTAEARAGVARIEARHAGADMEAARAPEQAPAAGTPEYAAWRRAQELWVDAQAWRTHRRQVVLLRTGFVASFVVQVVLTAWILVRVLGAHRRAHAAAARSEGRGGRS